PPLSAGRRAGVGPAVPVLELPASAAAARTALRFTAEGTDQDPGPRTVYADELGGLALLAGSVGPDTEPIPDVRALDRALAAAPWAAGTLHTVAYATSLRAAAAELNMHHSTLQDRLAQAEHWLGWPVHDPRGRLRLQLALALWRLHRNLHLRAGRQSGTSRHVTSCHVRSGRARTDTATPRHRMKDQFTLPPPQWSADERPLHDQSAYCDPMSATPPFPSRVTGRISAARLANTLGNWRVGGPRSGGKDLADALAALVHDGRLPPGIRLPPERELATALGVSRTMIGAACPRRGVGLCRYPGP
ncbi:helix-turn-helix domain-containing protein, partial [Streptomyces scopuliridis]|uniref:helix-turn-helix domain-containing protein n=1 Tax=Streptomyces scopuliridis TaxID=452529 RepID=UPI003B96865B